MQNEAPTEAPIDTRFSSARAQAIPDMPAQSPRLLLASASPRRRELLALFGTPFTSMSTDVEEQDGVVPAWLLARLPACPLPLPLHPVLRAWRKAQDIWQQRQDAVVLAADTVVMIGREVLNKPRDSAHARAMLTRLAGQSHTVYTGLCVCRPPAPLLDLVASQVTLQPLSADAIDAYVATGEPLDKAGAYGIQGLGGQLVQRVEGSYTAVVGLPVPATRDLLARAGITPLHNAHDIYSTWLQNQRKEPLPCPPTLP